MGGEYYSGDEAWKYIKNTTNVDLYAILERSIENLKWWNDDYMNDIIHDDCLNYMKKINDNSKDGQILKKDY